MLASSKSTYLSPMRKYEGTIAEYTKRGKIGQERLCEMYFNLRIPPMILEALLTIFPMCLFQRPLLLYVSPRCLWSDTKETGIASNFIFGRCSYSFKVNKRVSVL